jgi:hypothetical protein
MRCHPLMYYFGWTLCKLVAMFSTVKAFDFCFAVPPSMSLLEAFKALLCILINVLCNPTLLFH